MKLEQRTWWAADVLAIMRFELLEKIDDGGTASQSAVILACAEVAQNPSCRAELVST